jgi:adenylate cyclase
VPGVSRVRSADSGLPQECPGAQVSGPSAEAILQQLQKILSSPDFSPSERSREFLRYVVEETISGNADRIKAYSVALEVFHRDETFDAQNDPVVRIEAGRLRRALERYYLLDGKDDTVLIHIPKGGYVPVFEAKGPSVEPLPVGSVNARSERSSLWPGRTTIAVAATLVAALGAVLWSAMEIMPFNQAASVRNPTGPSVLVLPYVDLGDGTASAIYSAGLTDEIISALARFREIAVFGVQTSRSVEPSTGIAELHEKLNVQYVLEGGVRADTNSVRVSSRLLSASNGAVIWSRNDSHSLTAANLFEAQNRIAEEVATTIAQPYGIVFRTESDRGYSRPPDDLEAYLCTLRYYTYRATPTPDGHLAVRSCLENAVSRFPTYATAWALLAHIYTDQARHDLNSRNDATNSREQALSAAREAVRLDPDNARALQSLATALFYSQRVEESFDVGERALALNPHDAELLGQLGQLFGQAGRFEQGRGLLEQALAQNPAHSGFYRGVLAMIAYMQYDYDTALEEIEKADLQSLPIYQGVAAIIYVQKGLLEQARHAVDKFQERLPGFIPNLWAELDQRNIPPSSQVQIADGLRKIGVKVPPGGPEIATSVQANPD